MGENPVGDAPLLSGGAGIISGCVFALWLAVMLANALVAGCAATAPYAYLPYPDTVYVPHPDRVGSDLSEVKLRKMYTVSPNRNPDGLGALDSMERNSQITLMVVQVMLAFERPNRTAYARTEAEQQRILEAHKTFFRDNIVFHGVLLSGYPEGAKPESYMPEGIYLVDDRGRKFLPKQVEEQSPKSFLPPARRSEFGEVYIGYPILSFPREAITKDTRAITLHFAKLQRRVAFTWIFDKSYVPNLRRDDREHGRGFNRMWRAN